MDGTTETKKLTPQEFATRALEFNAELASIIENMADVQQQLDKHMTSRDTLIADAKNYGLTGAYARTLLRKP